VACVTGPADRLKRVLAAPQMASSAAGVGRCLGLVLGGGGRALLDQADAELRALGTRNPARLTATWLPGFDGAHDGPRQR
jgi:hypothetical protein